MTGGYRAKEKRSQNVNLTLLHASALPDSVDWCVCVCGHRLHMRGAALT